MTEKIELLPCPACGKTPHLQFDPNRRYFVECMECDIYLYAYTAYAPTCVRAWNDFVEATQPQWQPMDTAPRNGKTVLILTAHGEVKIRCCFEDKYGQSWWQHDSEHYDDGYPHHETSVVAWMPLPQLPESEVNDDREN